MEGFEVDWTLYFFSCVWLLELPPFIPEVVPEISSEEKESDCLPADR